MKPYQERVIKERDELEEKISKLSAFLDGDLFDSITAAEQERLVKLIMFLAVKCYA